MLKQGAENSKLHAAPFSNGSKLEITWCAQFVCQNNEGQINETESISAGLDYPGVSPMHCFSKETKEKSKIWGVSQ